MPKHLSVTQASVTSLLIYIVGQAVAFVPALSNSQQQLISVGSLVIAAIFGVLHLVQHYAVAKQKVTLTDLESGIRSIAADEVAKVPFAKIAESVIAGHGLSDIGGTVKTELNKILVATGLEHQAAVMVASPPAVPAVPADPNATHAPGA